ncbi:MAG: hypothetical protein PF636_09390, partial [Actinomycetota bacterium]|nr:hypothetical protein [Actinomycetota bacterium]
MNRRPRTLSHTGRPSRKPAAAVLVLLALVLVSIGAFSLSANKQPDSQQNLQTTSDAGHEVADASESDETEPADSSADDLGAAPSGGSDAENPAAANGESVRRASPRGNASPDNGAPTTAPAPAPNPVPGPAPTPYPDPDPAPDPEPIPDPDPEPTPDPDPEPEPTPDPEPVRAAEAFTVVAAHQANVLTWETPSVGSVPAGFTIERSSAKTGPFLAVASVSVTTTVFKDPVTETGYLYYRVSSLDETRGITAPTAARRNDRVLMSEDVGPEGLTLIAANGEVELTLPTGALDATRSIGVSETGDSPRMAGALRLASTYDLSPDGLALNVPAKLRIAYEVPVSHFQVSATLEAALELMSYDPGADTWEAVPSSLVPGEKMLEGSVPHFSYWSGASIQPHGTTPTKTSYCSGICHNLVAAPGSPDVIPSRAKEVCYNCHGNVTSDMPPAGATGRNVEAEFQDSSDLTHTAGVNSRHPVSAGDLDCTSCHDIHRDPSGGYTYLLKSYDAVTGRSVASKPGQPVGTAFCWTCHGTKASARINSVVPGYWTRTGDKKTNLVGTPHEVIDAPAGTGIVCSTCHGAHGSPSTALITTRTLNGDMVTGNDQTLCLACHDGAVGAYPGEPIYTQTGHSTVTVSSKAATSWPSSASAAGSCQNCHDPHGTTNDSYLREASEDLCAGCHDVSGLTYPADYSYQGASTYSNSGHGDISSTLSWTTFRSDSKGFAAWEGDTAPTPTTPGVALSAAEVDALLSVDGDRAITNETGVTGESDYQVYRFNVNTDPATLRTMTVRWEGFGEALAGYPTSVHVWNETLASGAGAWEQLASGDWANLTEVKSTLTTPSNYVDEGGNVYLMARAVNAVDADILTGPTVAVLNDTTVQVTWTTRGAANSWVDFGATATYGSTVGTDVESVSHSVNLSIEPTATYHYRIRSEDRDGETDASTDRTFAVPAPKPVLLGNIGGWPAPVPVTFNWTMTDTTRAPYTYRVYVSGPNGYGYASPWLSGMSHTLSLDYGLHYWRVFAQDVNGTITALSAVDSFIVFDDSGSCPFLFSWDGEDFGWEGDLYTTGKLASPRAGGTYKKPNPNDYYVLDRDLVAVDGTLEMRLVEERVETDYMDTFQLYAIDLPTNRDIAAEKIPQGGIYEPLEDIVHTVDSAMSAPLSAVIVETGEDVLARIAAPDGDYAVLSPDVELPGYQSVELDLGDLSDAPAIKLLFEGMSRFPETPEGKALGTAGVRQKVEVIGADGEWMALPGTWPKPAEFARPYLLDLTGLFPTDDYRVRLTFLLKTYVDAVRLDTTANADYTVTQVPMASAELRRHGRDSKSSGGDVYEYVYDEPASIEDFDVYLPGAYTRFGEVSPLLAETDDKFVIYGAGDELALRFDELPDPAPGMHRRYVVYANGFYKDLNTDVPSTVEPLPFQAMSNYPYGADETYPDDAEHDKYRTEWNTRVVGEPPLMDPADFDQAPLEAEVSAVNTEGAARAPLDVVKSIFESIGGFVSDLFSQNVSDDAAFRTTHAPSALVSVRTTQPISSDVPRSLHTDFVALDITIDDVASAPGDCAVCHDVHGSPDENGLVRPGLVAEREDVLCTSAGDGACHSSAANSVSGVNVLDQFTTSSNNTRHHDVTENAQDATGASIRCSDCHNPHSDGEDARFVNPETPGQDYQKDVSDYVGPTGEVFAAVGSRHDALPPVISGHWIDLNTLGADQPIIRWTTDEMSTSWIEYGETTAYGTEDGTDSMSTAHAVTLSSVTTGTVYHYRIRITDVLGNTGYSADAVFTPLQPPNAPTLVPEPDIDLWWDPAPTLQCSTVTSPDGDSVQYYFDVWTGSTHYTSGWIAGTSWTTPNLTDFRTYTWTVQARDAGHTYAVSPPSAADTFYTFNTGSCPFLFSWDGESFGYEGDLYTTGKLASPRAGNTYKKPNPNDYYVLDRDLVPLDGALELRLVEERVETDYLDTF